MEDIKLFLPMGWEHIMSWNALDHILFISALAVVFQLRQWKQVLLLITAFTIGHFLTLWLSVTGWVQFSDKWVEFLIPVTILLTAVSNFLRMSEKQSMELHYAMALGFGLIHGMGYANAIRFGLTEGQQLGWSLFGFNIGLELGQILVVSMILLIESIILKIGLKRSWWVNGISALIFFMAFQMLWERWPIH